MSIWATLLANHFLANILNGFNVGSELQMRLHLQSLGRVQWVRLDPYWASVFAGNSCMVAIVLAFRRSR
ncbi:hypothetical protein BU23DRAFT_302191 [Bimuria novae-zelandiae CBS 107.79]|uniref:Uncharacterized protein n=1 Tax=Bimuria novae-zelandiae CBS 107.79 TaxID=1447943 RepID=A0A6A5UQF4_9PLEO|nr:hypothetical protein BU23DRAFT_302191 [Bimuria novae-zelandiae CBS 107.79]